MVCRLEGRMREWLPREEEQHSLVCSTHWVCLAWTLRLEEAWPRGKEEEEEEEEEESCLPS